MAAPMMIPVNPAQKNDEHCRHKMQALEIKIEGSGNGIKTVFPNIDAIANKLGRPAVLLTKFFGYELGALSKFEARDNKHHVMGQFRLDILHEKVYEFVKRFVLCRNCQDPQTRFMLKGKKKILTMKCVACPHATNMEEDPKNARVNKLIAEALENGSAPEMVWTEGSAATNVGGANAASATGDATTTATAAAPAGSSIDKDKKIQAVANEQAATHKTEESTALAASQDKWVRPASDEASGTNPIVELIKVLKEQQQEAASSAATAKAHQLKTVHNMDDDDVVRLCFQAAVASGDDEKKPLSALASRAAFLRNFVAVARTQVDSAKKTRFISELVRVCKSAGAPDRVPVGLAMFLDEEICVRAEIQEWASTSLLKDAAKEAAKGKSTFYQSVAKSCEPLFAWMGVDFEVPSAEAGAAAAAAAGEKDKKEKKEKSDKKEKKSKE